MVKAAKRALQVLAAITAAEGLLGFAATAALFVSLLGPGAGAAPERFPSGTLAVARAMMAVNTLFEGGLLWYATLLWRLSRIGLRALLWILAGEAAYIGVVIGLELSGWRAEAVASAVGIGNMGIAVQLITAFPLVAGALILFAHRTLAKQARREEASAGTTPSAAAPSRSRLGLATARQRFRLVMRGLAVATFLEAVAGTWEAGRAWTYLRAHRPSHTGNIVLAALHGPYAALTFDFVLGATVALSAALLWRLSEAGPWILGATIVAEAILSRFFPFVWVRTGSGGLGVSLLALLSAPLFGFQFQVFGRPWSPHPAPGSPFAAPWGYGNLFVGTQLLTAFPLVAAVMIVLASYYREELEAERGPRPVRTAAVSWKAMIAMRLLAAVTLVQGAAGLSGIRLTLMTLRTPVTQQVMFHGSHEQIAAGYVMLAASLIFSLMMLSSALLLWRLRRAGLLLLILTLGSEFAGYVGAALSPYAAGIFAADSLANFQLTSAYPVVAVALISLICRWLRPGRTPVQ